jgi:hypothetical protein
MRRRSSQGGRAILETALVLGVFMLILVALVDLAQVLFTHASLSHHVRSAARLAVNTTPLDQRRIREAVLDAGFHLRPENVEIEELDSGSDEHRIEVRIVDYRYTAISPAMAAFRNARPIVASQPLSVND